MSPPVASRAYKLLGPASPRHPTTADRFRLPAASELASKFPRLVGRWMLGACRSCGQKTAHSLADIVCWYLPSQVSSSNSADPLPATRAVGRCEAKRRHPDGNATALPDSAAFPVVFPGCYVFTTHSLRCGCAGRSYRSHSTSQLLQSHGSEAHDANETRPSGIKLAPVAYGYEPVVCAKTSIKPCAFGR